MNENLPPDPELEAFYEAERARPPLEDGARRAALARVLTAGTAATATTVATGVSTSLAVGGAIAMLGVGIVLGALGHAAWIGPSSRSEGTAAPAIAAPAPPPPTRDEAPPPAVDEPRDDTAIEIAPDIALEAPIAPASEPEAAHAEPTARPSTREPDAPTSDDGLASEMTLLARAQTALQRGLFPSALSALDEHARRFPRGQLAEEREALAVQALVRADRVEDARRRAARFDARYPHSVLGPVVHAALEGAP